MNPERLDWKGSLLILTLTSVAVGFLVSRDQPTSSTLVVGLAGFFMGVLCILLRIATERVRAQSGATLLVVICSPLAGALALFPVSRVLSTAYLSGSFLGFCAAATTAALVRSMHVRGVDPVARDSRR